MVVSPDGTELAVVTGSNFSAARAAHHRSGDQDAEAVDRDRRQLRGRRLQPGRRPHLRRRQHQQQRGVLRPRRGRHLRRRGSLSIPSSAPSGLRVSRDGSTALRRAQHREPGGGDRHRRPARSWHACRWASLPYTTVVSADGSKVYVSNWGGRVPGPDRRHRRDVPDRRRSAHGHPGRAARCRSSTPRRTRSSKTIEVGLHPTGMALSPRGDRLYVTNANSDTISAIDTATDEVKATLHVGLRRRARCAGAGQLAQRDGGEPGRPHAVRGQRVPERGGGRRPRCQPRRTRSPASSRPAGIRRRSRSTTRASSCFIASGYGFGSIAPDAARPHRAQLHGSRGRGLDPRRARAARAGALHQGGAREQPHGQRTIATTIRRPRRRPRSRRRREPDPHAPRAGLADQARLLHHQGEPHLRPGVRRPAAGQR